MKAAFFILMLFVTQLSLLSAQGFRVDDGGVRLPDVPLIRGDVEEQRTYTYGEDDFERFRDEIQKIRSRQDIDQHNPRFKKIEIKRIPPTFNPAPAR